MLQGESLSVLTYFPRMKKIKIRQLALADFY